MTKQARRMGRRDPIKAGFTGLIGKAIGRIGLMKDVLAKRLVAVESANILAKLGVDLTVEASGRNIVAVRPMRAPTRSSPMTWPTSRRTQRASI
jgi:hypothetical protein